MEFIFGWSSCTEGAGSGMILTGPTREVTYTLRFDFQASNESGYEALVIGLHLAIKMGCKHIHAFIDSMVISNQANWLYEIQGKNLVQYEEKVKALTKKFTSFRLDHVPRSKNKRADVLSKLESSTLPHLTKKVLVEIVQTKEIDKKTSNVSNNIHE